MLRFMNAANAVSLVGLCSAVAAVLLAVHGRLALAIIALVGCGICDLLDGLVARALERTEEEQTFGGRLDSVVDACAFGFTPVLLLHAGGLTSLAELPLLGLIPIASVWRLAYFDTIGPTKRDGITYYFGVPVTTVALILPVAGLAGLAGAEALRIAFIAAAIVTPILMLSPIQFRKPRKKGYVFFAGVAVALISTYVYLAVAGDYPAAAAA